MKFLPLALAAVVAASMGPSSSSSSSALSSSSVEAFSPPHTRIHGSTTSMGRASNAGAFSSNGRKTRMSSTVTEPEIEGASSFEKAAEKEFVNNGPMAWMQQYLDLAGIVPGQTIAYGPFTTGQVEESLRTPAQEAAKRQEEAARNLQNIDMDERNRRLNASKVMAVGTAVYAVWAALIGDQGDLGGHILRFMTFLPLMLAVGYRLSSQTGL